MNYDFSVLLAGGAVALVVIIGPVVAFGLSVFYSQKKHAERLRKNARERGWP